MRRPAVLLNIFFLSACAKPFQPMPPAYELWSKPGADYLDVKKAMLDCGKPSPDPTIKSYENAFGLLSDDEQLNYFFLTDSCLEGAGFKPHRYTVDQYCSWDRHKSLPICQPGAEVPKPSIERRLNSWWCRMKTDYAYCIKHAVLPATCDDPEKDYSNPPPECLP